MKSPAPDKLTVGSCRRMTKVFFTAAQLRCVAKTVGKVGLDVTDGGYAGGYPFFFTHSDDWSVCEAVLIVPDRGQVGLTPDELDICRLLGMAQALDRVDVCLVTSGGYGKTVSSRLMLGIYEASRDDGPSRLM